jgi:formamidopyrimidine-DNA glycosylase
MPELPEVEGLRRRLVPLVTGERIRSLDVRDQKLWRPAGELHWDDVAGATVEGLDRRAKLLIWRLDRPLSLVLHLKIAGQVVFQSASGERIIGGHPYPLPEAVLPDGSTRFTLLLDDGAIIFINDQRRFCWLRLLSAEDVGPFVAGQKFGPDPTAPDFTPHVLAGRLSLRKGRPIKAALLDQTCLAGVGNIYADEALHGARLHPMNRAGDLTPRQIERLHASLVAVLNRAISVGGALVKGSRAIDDVDSGRNFLRAHGRAGDECPDCAETWSGPLAARPRIVREELAGRGTYFCPTCQPPPTTHS